jgi:DNA-binding response OmpR family regulator
VGTGHVTIGACFRNGEIISQEMLLEHVWDMQANPLTNTVRVHINSLRRKLEDVAEAPRYIETIIGQGYRLGVPRIAS